MPGAGRDPGRRRTGGLQRLVLTVCRAGAPGVSSKGCSEGIGDCQAVAVPGDEFIIPPSSPGQEVGAAVPVLQSQKLNSHRKAR